MLVEIFNLISDYLSNNIKKRKDRIIFLKKLIEQDRNEYILNSNYKWNQIFNLNEDFYLPLNTKVKVIGIDSEKIHIFKSAKTPLLIPFILNNNGKKNI
jgi:hypothetical protein